MGYYINPPDMTKEAFLATRGKEISPDQVLDLFDGSHGMIPVCLVNNPGFTAAAIAYDREEATHFLVPDPRPKKWFAVLREDLKPYCRKL